MASLADSFLADLEDLSGDESDEREQHDGEEVSVQGGLGTVTVPLQAAVIAAACYLLQRLHSRRA